MPQITCLTNKNILLGISGSVAAEKACLLIDLLQKSKANVKVICTDSAAHFLAVEQLSHVEVFVDIFATAKQQMDHIHLAKWADILLIAPASAGILSRCATGSANDLLSLVYLATAAKVFFAPAMNQQMWQHAAVQRNVALVQQAGAQLLGPAYGEQACGDIGYGRMLEPDVIVAQLSEYYQQNAAGLKVLITAGPTQEAIDPVRYLSNHSSGKMGYALAEAFAQHGAEVTLISGPTHLALPHVTRCINVISALDMQAAVLDHVAEQDIFISAAAVADYRSKEIQPNKIKKAGETLHLELIKNPDILQTVRAQSPNVFLVGFSLETENLIANAEQKLNAKQLDMIIANQLSKQNPVFDADENAVTVLQRNGERFEYPIRSKQLLAEQLTVLISSSYQHHVD